MNNFEYYNPVRILFGKGKTSEISQHIPNDQPVLLMYGLGSIHKNGVYDQVINALDGYQVIEFSGIMPNPTYEYLLPAIELVKEKNIGFILAVGGGSVIDAAKFVAAGAKFGDSDPWEIIINRSPIKEAIPLGCVLTLPATGTEMNGNSVITRESVGQKLAFSSPKVLPVFSVLDPEFTYSLPKNQLANGVIDAFVHVIEQYLTYPSYASVQERLAEDLLNIIKEEGSRLFASEEPDYKSRANFMWAATNALNTFISMGVVSDWSTHSIGHELTVLHGLDHAVSLAIVLPGVMNFVRISRKEKLLQYADKVWGISSFDEMAVIDEAIRNTEQFFQCLGVKTKLSEYGIGPEVVDKILHNFERRGVQYLGNTKDIQALDIPEILERQL